MSLSNPEPVEPPPLSPSATSPPRVGDHRRQSSIRVKQTGARRPMTSLPITLTINGHRHELEVDARVTLLDLLRERLDLNGTKKGCDRGQCGACTVLVD